MVDNFDLIRKLLRFEEEGDCYYVQLLRRQSDDPHIDGKSDPKYHGNMHSRSIKDYLITSLDHFDTVKEDIIKLCITFNVRAYIRLNKRNFKQISLAMLKHIVDQTYSGQSYNSPYRVVSSAAGTACCAGEDKTWVVDLDEEYLPYQDTIIDMICHCEPHVRRIAALKETCPECDAQAVYIDGQFHIIPTKHGRHVICKPFNLKAIDDMWKSFCKDSSVTLPLPRRFNDPENRYTTFELTDTYLSKAKEFASFLPEHKTIKNDSNKITFITDKLSDWDLHMLEFYWHGQCLKNRYFMKTFDCHKDNPTALFFP